MVISARRKFIEVFIEMGATDLKYKVVDTNTTHLSDRLNSYYLPGYRSANGDEFGKFNGSISIMGKDSGMFFIDSSETGFNSTLRISMADTTPDNHQLFQSFIEKINITPSDFIVFAVKDMTTERAEYFYFKSIITGSVISCTPAFSNDEEAYRYAYQVYQYIEELINFITKKVIENGLL